MNSRGQLACSPAAGPSAANGHLDCIKSDMRSITQSCCSFSPPVEQSDYNLGRLADCEVIMQEEPVSCEQGFAQRQKAQDFT